ncbi:MAG: hypothetical protein ACR2IE_20320 [Candidatus Sumerlaeaceae bacterium]
MSDKTKHYIRLAERNLGRIVMGVLLFILVGLAYALYSEQSNTVGVDAEGGMPARLEDPLPKNPHFLRITTMSTPQDLASSPPIQQVAQYNMFDYKSVRDKQEIERGADQKFAQAQDAATKGQPDEAKRLLGEILKQVPTHKKARELSEKLNSAATAKPAATATPVP